MNDFFYLWILFEGAEALTPTVHPASSLYVALHSTYPLWAVWRVGKSEYLQLQRPLRPQMTNWNHISVTRYRYNWELCRQKQVSQVGISNYIPQFTVGCNYLSLPEIPASGDQVLNWLYVPCQHTWKYDTVHSFSTGIALAKSTKCWGTTVLFSMLHCCFI